MKIVIIILSVIVGLLLMNIVCFSQKQIEIAKEMDFKLLKPACLPIRESGFYVIELEGHEYMLYNDSSRAGITHLASCRYCSKEK